MEYIGGKISLESTEEVGTKVILEIPYTKRLAFSHDFNPINPYQALVILDADPSIHLSMAKVFEKNRTMEKKYFFETITAATDFITSGSSNKKNTLFLVDNDLPESTGYSFIRDNNLQSSSILLTAILTEELMEQCINDRIHFFPKNLINYYQIERSQ